MKNSSSKQSGKMDMLHGSLLDKILLFAMPLAASDWNCGLSYLV